MGDRETRHLLICVELGFGKLKSFATLSLTFIRSLCNLPAFSYCQLQVDFLMDEVSSSRLNNDDTIFRVFSFPLHVKHIHFKGTMNNSPERKKRKN